MKQIYLLAIILAIISCKNESRSEADFISYHHGIQAFEKTDNDGITNYSKALELFNKSIEQYPDQLDSYRMKMLCELISGQH